MKTVNILLGGPISEYPLQLLNNPELISGPWVAADHGATFLLQKGIVPKYAVGDFDSSTVGEISGVSKRIDNVITVPAEKDFTDSQLALKTAIKNFEFDQINIYGATGGRIDHLLVNLFLGLELEFEKVIEQVKLIDENNYMEFFKPGKHRIKKITNMKYVGFVNLEPIKNLNLVNSKYKLNNFSSQRSISFASNEFVEENINFDFEKGTVLVIQSKDKDK